MRMANRGLPVPPGFVLGVDLSAAYLTQGAEALDGLESVLHREMEHLGQVTGRHFGDAKRPLLVSVRSGAAISMPGMMETVLNVGLTPETLRGLIRLTGAPRLAHDCRRRLIQQFAEAAYGASPKPFEDVLTARLAEGGLSSLEELDSDQLSALAGAYEDLFEAAAGFPFPGDPMAQLRTAVEAVLKSWMSERAQSYRALNGISDCLGTATLIEAMVFGNAGPASGSGVGFTRSPADGADGLYVDYLANAQGEDVVSGLRSALGLDELERRVPDAATELRQIKRQLEAEFGDMQDFEFTVDQGRLYMLQSRAGARTPLAALRIAHDLAVEGLITRAEALERLEDLDIGSIDATALDAPQDLAPLAHGTPASVGVAIGVAVFDPARVAGMKRDGRPVVLLREHAETADLTALSKSAALVTAKGARTSHPAVVARQLGKACIVGCASLKIDPDGRSGCFGETVVREGDLLSLDAATGLIFGGQLAVREGKPKALLDAVARWRKEGAT